MAGNRVSPRIEDNVRHSRRQFLGGAMAAVAAGSLLETAATLAANAPTGKAKLWIGAATTDVTPTGPVALLGQFNLRIAKTVETPLTANVIVLESRGRSIAGRGRDGFVRPGVDLQGTPAHGAPRDAKASAGLGPEEDIRQCHTHAHGAGHRRCVVQRVFDSQDRSRAGRGIYRVPCRRVAEAVEKAWKGRTPGSATWGLGHAVVARNRRAVYADGHAVMLGNTNSADFRGLEGYEDHDVDALFFWGESGELLALAVNVPCPARESRRGQPSTPTSGIPCASRCADDTAPKCACWAGSARPATNARPSILT